MGKRTQYTDLPGVYLTVLARQTWPIVEGADTGTFFCLKFIDCRAEVVRDDGSEVGHVTGTFGGGLELVAHDPDLMLHLRVDDLWKAFLCAAQLHHHGFEGGAGI